MNPLTTIKPWVVKNEPDILMWMGVAGFIGSIPLIIRGSIRGYKNIQQRKEELKIDKLPVKETIKCVWKEVIAPTVIIASAVTCVVAGNKVSAKRNAALAAAYTVTETALQEYQEKTKELVGEEKEKQIQEAVNKKDNSKANNVIITGKAQIRFKESLTGQIIQSDWTLIQKMANELNARAIGGEDTITLNDWLQAIGADPVDYGDNVGWSVYKSGAKGLINVELDAALDNDDNPIGVIQYSGGAEELSNM